MTLEDDCRALLQTVNGRGWNLYDGTDYRNLFFKIKKNMKTLPDLSKWSYD